MFPTEQNLNIYSFDEINNNKVNEALDEAKPLYN